MSLPVNVPNDRDPVEVTDELVADRNLVRSLLHGLTILDMFERDRRVIAIGDMARTLNLHKSSASRLAATLAAAGYLEPTTTPGNYRLGSRVAVVGELAAEDSDIERIVLPYLTRLTWLTGETGHLALLEGADTRTLAVTDGWHTVRMHSWVGKTSPAYCSSMGKALLAGLASDTVRDLYPSPELPKITEHTVKDVDALMKDLESLRSNGYGFDDEELVPGLRCISAPIVGRNGAVVASISISGPTQRLDYDAVQKVSEHVRWAAAQASKALGASPFTPLGWAESPLTEPAMLDWVEQVRPERFQRAPEH